MENSILDKEDKPQEDEEMVEGILNVNREKK